MVLLIKSNYYESNVRFVAFLISLGELHPIIFHHIIPASNRLAGATLFSGAAKSLYPPPLPPLLKNY